MTCDHIMQEQRGAGAHSLEKVASADEHSFFAASAFGVHPVNHGPWGRRNVGGKWGWRMTLACHVSVFCVVVWFICQNQLILFLFFK